MRTNVEGAAQTVETFAPLLSKAGNPRVIFMSSTLGSHTRVAELHIGKDWPAYSTTKAAVNMIMLWFANHYPGWKVNACCPGFRVRLSSYILQFNEYADFGKATNLNNFATAGTQSPIPGKLEDGAMNAVRLTLLGKDGETATFTSRDDKTGEIRSLPW